MEILIGILLGNPFHRAFNSHLSPERRPIEEQAGARIFLEFVTLATVVVRVKDKAWIGKALHHDDSGARQAVSGRSRKRHRNRVLLRDTRGGQFLKPFFELDRKSVVGKECRSRWSPYH